MKSIPILFSTPMVQAIMEGRKTQTRRVIKHQPPQQFSNFGNAIAFVTDRTINHSVYCPYGQVGDVLWVKENHYAYGIWLKNGKTKTGKQKWKFVRDIAYTLVAYLDNPPKNILSNKERETHGWFKRSSLFMPKEATRLFLKITDIRVEQLQDICEADAVMEGIELQFDHQNVQGYKNYIHGMLPCPARKSFETLWHSINGEDSWNSNPWVWVISFERIKKPENFM